jgi:UDP-2,4-diacetamido-2,4,6-trideoxy-beta-L-altropyranose hydrolase
MPDVLIRADASSAIGTGHIMRCLVLAQLLQDAGFTVAFLCREVPEHLVQRIRQAGYPLLPVTAAAGDAELQEIVGLVNAQQARLLVFDHYGLDADFEQAVSSASGVRVLVIDDTYQRHHADILLNPNIYAEAEAYAGLVPATCRVLCGLGWALVRKEFRVATTHAQKKRSPGAVDILVTLGGSDPDNITSDVLDALAGIDSPRVTATVVIGPASTHREAVQASAAALAERAQVISNAGNMAQLMRSADCVITASGGTFIETLFCSVPTLLVNIASNQDISYAFARARNISYLLDKNDLKATIQEALRELDGATGRHRNIMANRQQLLEQAQVFDLAAEVRAVIGKSPS